MAEPEAEKRSVQARSAARRQHPDSQHEVVFSMKWAYLLDSGGRLGNVGTGRPLRCALAKRPSSRKHWAGADSSGQSRSRHAS